MSELRIVVREEHGGKIARSIIDGTVNEILNNWVILTAQICQETGLTADMLATSLPISVKRYQELDTGDSIRTNIRTMRQQIEDGEV